MQICWINLLSKKLNRAKYYYENDKERLRDQQIP